MIKPRPRTHADRPMTQDWDFIKYLLLLRYGSATEEAVKTPILNIASIAKLTHKPHSTVSFLLKLGLKSLSEGVFIEKVPRSKLDGHHIEYLTNRETLKEWAHLSLKQRSQMFHRQFGEVKASANLIRKTYLKQGIRFKTINRVKKEIDFTVDYYRDLFMTMFKLVSLAKAWEKKIVYLDEAVFSFNTFKAKAWSPAYSTVNVTESKIKIKT